jgi:hypothetical protein
LLRVIIIRKEYDRIKPEMAFVLAILSISPFSNMIASKRPIVIQIMANMGFLDVGSMVWVIKNGLP